MEMFPSCVNTQELLSVQYQLRGESFKMVKDEAEVALVYRPGAAAWPEWWVLLVSLQPGHQWLPSVKENELHAPRLLFHSLAFSFSIQILLSCIAAKELERRRPRGVCCRLC